MGNVVSEVGKSSAPTTSPWVKSSTAFIWFMVWAIGGAPVGCTIGLLVGGESYGGLVVALLGTAVGGLVGIIGGVCTAGFLYRKNK